MLSNWQLFEKRFSKETCRRIVTLASLLPEAPALVGSDKNASIAAPEIRTSKIRWLGEGTPDLKDLFLDVRDMFWEANRSFGFDINYLPPLQFTEYHGNVSGRYNWHIDTQFESQCLSHRKISMVIQLSDPDEYEGGNLELQPFFYEPPPPDILRQQGSVIFFPSITYHQVTPVTKGTRYSLVGWMEGPRWK